MEILEIWKPITHFGNNYEISSFGRVRRNGRLRKNETTKDNYERILLTNGGFQKRFMVHRLVAQYFIRNLENKPQVNHINGVKNDNRLENLEWCTRSENQIHAYKMGLQKPNMSEKCKLLGRQAHCRKVIDIVTNKLYNSIKEASHDIGISNRLLGSYLNGKIKNNKTTLRLY